MIFGLGQAETAVGFGDLDAEGANLPQSCERILRDVSFSIDSLRVHFLDQQQTECVFECFASRLMAGSE